MHWVKYRFVLVVSSRLNGLIPPTALGFSFQRWSSFQVVCILDLEVVVVVVIASRGNRRYGSYLPIHFYVNWFSLIILNLTLCTSTIFSCDGLRTLSHHLSVLVTWDWNNLTFGFLRYLFLEWRIGFLVLVQSWRHPDSMDATQCSKLPLYCS